MNGVIKILMNNSKPYMRPVYSSYQIGELVISTRQKSDLTQEELATQWNIDIKQLDLIEQGKRVLNPKLYKLVSEFTGVAMVELMKIEKDTESILCRKEDGIDEDLAQKSINLANYLFHEILVQNSLIGD